MPTISPRHTVEITLSTKDYIAFQNARRRLRRRMGVLAPSMAQLCAHQLTGRDPGGLVEDYLSAVGWPIAPGKPRRGTRRGGDKRLLTDLRAAAPRIPREVDRN